MSAASAAVLIMAFQSPPPVRGRVGEGVKRLILHPTPILPFPLNGEGTLVYINA